MDVMGICFFGDMELHVEVFFSASIRAVSILKLTSILGDKIVYLSADISIREELKLWIRLRGTPAHRTSIPERCFHVWIHLLQYTFPQQLA